MLNFCIDLGLSRVVKCKYVATIIITTIIIIIGCSLSRLQAYTFVVVIIIITRKWSKRLLHSCQNYWADQDETLQRCRPWSPTMLVFFRIWKLFTVCPLGGQEILTFLAFEGASAQTGWPIVIKFYSVNVLRVGYVLAISVWSRD